MEFLELGWVQWVLGVVAGLVTLWVIPNGFWARLISFFGAKLAPVMDKVARGLDGAGALADGVGFEKIAGAAYKLSDVVDEAEDIPRLLAEYTEDKELDEDEIKSLIKETGEFGVAGKDFFIYDFKKKPE